ncbi:MAG TPA: phosphoglycerate kinase [Solirubrobacteraceae bacterium]|nr:phosphoglycerate kinase [Solirubrobacteraceae bacterium]
MRTIDSLGDIDGQRVFVRVDFNVPIADGKVRDDARMRRAIPTLAALRDKGAKLLLVSHLGRPKNHEPEFSLKPVAEHAAKLLHTDVQLAPDLDSVPDGDVVMLENIRYEPGETKNDPELAKRLASLADYYVNDAFGTSHREHASTAGIIPFMKHSAAGLLFQSEVDTIRLIMNHADRPFLAIMGGAKVTDKIAVVDKFLDVADVVLVGGAMATPFLKVLGHDIGDSLCEEAGLALARQALQKDGYPNGKLRLPVDLVVADQFSQEAEVQIIQGVDVPDGWMQLDIGSMTRTLYVAEIRKAETIFWNGPIGAFEHKSFAAGSLAIAQAMAQTESVTVVGGGDSGAAMAEFGLAHSITHLSTGGGAALKLIEGAKLPGVEALRKK